MFKKGQWVICTNARDSGGELVPNGYYIVESYNQVQDSVKLDNGNIWERTRFSLLSPQPDTAATKHDAGKPPLSIIPMSALELEARVFDFGAKKYSRNNFRKGFCHTRLIDAALRHIYAFNEGQDNDVESSLSHLGHARCCLAMLIEGIANGNGTDDRYKPETKEKEGK